MDLKMLGALLLALSMAADAGDEKAKSYYEQLVAGLGDQVQPALDAANAGDGSSGEDDMYAGMGEDEKKLVASMPDDMKATYMAGKKAMAAQVAAEADKKDDAIAAGEKVEPVAAGMDLDTLNKIAAGEDVQAMSARQKMVDEGVRAGLVSKSMAKILLDPTKTTEKVAAEFIAGRKTKSVTVGGPAQQRMGAPEPHAKKDPLGVSREDRIAAEQLAKKVPGVNLDKLLAQLAENNKKAQ